MKMQPVFGKMGRNFVVDHRGAQIRHARPSDNLPDSVAFVLHPENTLAAFRESFEQGHDVELDVNSNGETYVRNGKTYPYLPVFHDDAIGSPFRVVPEPKDRLLRNLPTHTMQGAVLDRDDLIRRVVHRRLGRKAVNRVHVDAGTEAGRIPALDEVFELLKRYPGSHVYVELKTLTQGDREDTKRLEESVVALVKEFGVEDQVTVIGFNPFCLDKVKRLAREAGLDRLTTGWDVETNLYLGNPFQFARNRLPGWVRSGLDHLLAAVGVRRHKLEAGSAGMEQVLGWAKRIDADALLPAYEETSRRLVDAAHQAGLKVLPWVWADTCEGEIRRIPALMEMGVDGVITNVPTDAAQAVARHQARRQKG